MGSKLIQKFPLRFIPGFIKNRIVSPYENIIKSKDSIIKSKAKEEMYVNLSFSQEGEDLILFRLLGDISKGFYVDIGAHHPLRFSNTYKFYKLGWHGINIDALPGSMEDFKERRPNDINLEMAISNNSEEKCKYYMFNEPALNTLDEYHALSIIKNNLDAYILKTIQVPIFKLSDILNTHLPKGQKIDFMNIDVEGSDLNVIESNDWDEFRPTFLVVESLSTKFEDALNSEISIKLKTYGYSLISKTVNSLIFKNEKDYQIK
jgi:FkbM family methyltransferase